MENWNLGIIHTAYSLGLGYKAVNYTSTIFIILINIGYEIIYIICIYLYHIIYACWKFHPYKLYTLNY